MFRRQWIHSAVEQLPLGVAFCAGRVVAMDSKRLSHYNFFLRCLNVSYGDLQCTLLRPTAFIFLKIETQPFHRLAKAFLSSLQCNSNSRERTNLLIVRISLLTSWYSEVCLSTDHFPKSSNGRTLNFSSPCNSSRCYCISEVLTMLFILRTLFTTASTAGAIALHIGISNVLFFFSPLHTWSTV
jgi:hypothetical protein